MLKIRFFHALCFLFLWIGLGQMAQASPMVTCNNPTATASTGGGTVTLNVLCTLSSLSGLDTLTPAASNIVAPSTLTLSSGSNVITATLQSVVTSPTGTVTGILGLPLIGFIGVLTPPTATLQFQYQVTTTALTPAGTYNSATGGVAFDWRISEIPFGISSGIANSTLQVTVPAPPTVINCTSPSVNAPSGGGSYTMNVTCTVTGSGSSFSPAASNRFSPATLVLTNSSNGSSTLSANLNSTITSPDATVTGISGTAGGGFTGTINAIPATIQAQYSGTTTNTTTAGTYNSGVITYTWSTL